MEAAVEELVAKMNLTYTTAMVLHAVAEGYRYGFDIMEGSGLPDGTVYPVLRRLEASGHLRSEWDDEAEATAQKRPQRRYYELTGQGQALLHDARDRFPGLRWSVGSKPVPGAERA